MAGGQNVKSSLVLLFDCNAIAHCNMSNKYLINSVEKCVDESLYGFSKLHSHLECYFSEKIVFDAEACDKQKISIISGGGSGHEPFPAGYVGAGMLTASVSGPIFTSPPSRHILQCIRLAARKSTGVLLIVPNYTGDVLNFGLAAEIACSEGISVETIIVGEDVAQEIIEISSKAGRRGMCGLIFAFKVAGHLSRKGTKLSDIKQLCEKAVKLMASLGLCVSSCSKPGVGLLFQLSSKQTELGVGVHGEAGVARLKLMTAHEAIEILINHLSNRLKLEKGSEVVVAINNLGALTHIEQWLLTGEVEKQLSERNVSLLRLYAGHFFTSLNMSGLQITILKLDPNTKEIFLEAFDSPTEASAWPKQNIYKENQIKNQSFSHISKSLPKGFEISSEKALLLKRCLEKAAERLTEAKDYLNRLDTTCGDGDCGTTFGNIAREILFKTKTLNFLSPASVFYDLSLAMQESIGGTSGALYGLFFKGISDELSRSCYDCLTVSKCWTSGIDRIKKYSSARLGDRTMLDPLESACETFKKKLEDRFCESIEAYHSAVKAAEMACQNTKTMKAYAGRASYTNPSHQTDVDAGAYAVTVWLKAISEEIYS